MTSSLEGFFPCEKLGQVPTRVGGATSNTSMEIFIFEAILPSKTKSSKGTPYGTHVPRLEGKDTQWAQHYNLGVRGLCCLTKSP